MENSKKASLLSELLNNLSKKPQKRKEGTNMTRVADSALAYISGAKGGELEIYVKWTKGN